MSEFKQLVPEPAVAEKVNDAEIFRENTEPDQEPEHSPEKRRVFLEYLMQWARKPASKKKLAFLAP